MNLSTNSREADEETVDNSNKRYPKSLPEHLGALWTSVPLVCPEVLCQQGGVREGAATQGTLVAAMGLAMDPCLVPFQRLLSAEPSATSLTQDAALQALEKP